MTGAIDAYEASDQRSPGWIKVELERFLNALAASELPDGPIYIYRSRSDTDISRVRRDRFEVFEPTLRWAGRIRKEERMATSLGDVAADFDKGLFAGVASTAAMTVSSTLEMKLSGCGVSQTPAQAAEEVLNVQPEDEESEARFSNLVHLAYGTSWGGVPHHSP